jgi:hypothetical protein
MSREWPQRPMMMYFEEFVDNQMTVMTTLNPTLIGIPEAYTIVVRNSLNIVM